MQANFTLSPEDFARFQKLVTKRFKRSLSMFSILYLVQVAFWMFLGMSAALLFGLIQQQPTLASSIHVIAALLLLALVCMFVAAPVQQATLRKYMLLPNGAFLCSHTIFISEASMIIETERGRSEMPWSSFLGLESDDKNYYLLLDAMQAVIVPRAAVAPFRSEFEGRLALIKNAV